MSTMQISPWGIGGSWRISLGRRTLHGLTCSSLAPSLSLSSSHSCRDCWPDLDRLYCLRSLVCFSMGRRHEKGTIYTRYTQHLEWNAQLTLAQNSGSTPTPNRKKAPLSFPKNPNLNNTEPKSPSPSPWTRSRHTFWPVS